MNRLFVLALVLILIVFLTGCYSDEKRVDKIHKIIEESLVFEKEFAINLAELEEAGKNAQLIYSELIGLNIGDKDIISQKIDRANRYIKEQLELLAGAEENFDKAYKKALSIEGNIKKIKDEKQKSQALKVLTLMDERKKLVNIFFEDYHESLEGQDNFYRHLEDEKVSVEKLDKQIKDLNKRRKDMGEMIEKFNQYTEQYIEAENKLY